MSAKISGRLYHVKEEAIDPTAETRGAFFQEAEIHHSPKTKAISEIVGGCLWQRLRWPQNLKRTRSKQRRKLILVTKHHMSSVKDVERSYLKSNTCTELAVYAAQGQMLQANVSNDRMRNSAGVVGRVDNLIATNSILEPTPLAKIVPTPPVRVPFRRQGHAPSVGVFTVQCANCLKWRVVPTKEQYEAIRQCNLIYPWVCEDGRSWRPNLSCDEEPDLSQNSMPAIWAMDKASIPCTPPGWERKLVIRSEGCSKFSDIYYISPCGKKLRSMVEVQRFLNENPAYIEAGIRMSDFSYASPQPLDSNYVRKRTPVRQLTEAQAMRGQLPQGKAMRGQLKHPPLALQGMPNMLTPHAYNQPTSAEQGSAVPPYAIPQSNYRVDSSCGGAEHAGFNLQHQFTVPASYASFTRNPSIPPAGAYFLPGLTDNCNSNITDNNSNLFWNGCVRDTGPMTGQIEDFGMSNSNPLTNNLPWGHHGDGNSSLLSSNAMFNITNRDNFRFPPM